METTDLKQRLEQQTFNHLPQKHYYEQKEYVKRAGTGSKPEEVKKLKTNAKSFLVSLSVAFNMALDNYEAIRPVKEFKQLTLTESATMLLQFFQNKHADLIKALKDNNTVQLQQFAALEYKLFELVRKLRNYHSHYIHEPGVTGCIDLFETDKYPEKKLLKAAEYAEVKDWLEQKFSEAKMHLLKSLNEKKELLTAEKNAEKNTLKQIEQAIEKIESFQFMHGQNISYVGQLFIACMFLRKSQANLVLSNWTGIKRTEGYLKSVNTFFSYYSLKDKHTLTNEHENLYAFRSIVSQLSTMAFINHPDFIPVYKAINEKNARVNEVIEDKKLKLKRMSRKPADDPEKKKIVNEIEDISRKIIPVRKKRNFTYWLLRYLEDNGLLADFKIACTKEPVDRLGYLADNGLANLSLIELKDKIKVLDRQSAERKKLKVHYAALKRNFLFKTAGQTGYRYAIKAKNALLQYCANGDEVNITVSPALLTKWVFIHLTDSEKGRQVTGNLISYIQHYRAVLQNKATDLAGVKGSYKGQVPLNKVFPESILTNYTIAEANNRYEDIVTPEAVKRKIDLRLQELEDFYNVNRNQLKPWKFASKRKIDLVLDYAHYHYRKRFLETGTGDEDFARRESPREAAYLDAANFIRFFSRFKDTGDFKKFFGQYSVYYAGITGYFKQCRKLEDLFNIVIEKYIGELKTLRVNENNKQLLGRLFHIKKPAVTESVQQAIGSFRNNMALPPDAISLKEVFAAGWGEFNAGKVKKHEGKPNFISDFSFIRSKLSEGNSLPTNTDYLMQYVLPGIDAQAGLKKQNGALKNSIIGELLKLKTEELLLWQIANYYWKEVYHTNYVIAEQQPGAIFGQSPVRSIFEKPTQINMLAKVKIKNGINPYPGIPAGEHRYKLNISPRKFDDEFIYGAQKNMHDYYLLYAYPNGTHELDFLAVAQQIKNELRKSKNDIYPLLCLEKFFIDKNLQQAKTRMQDKYRDNPDSKITDYYLEFKQVQNLFDEIFEGDEVAKNYLVSFRNFALHYRLQNPELYPLVKAKLEKKVKDIGQALPEPNKTYAGNVKKKKLNDRKPLSKKYH